MITLVLTINFQLLTLNSFAQAPQKMSYQAVIRNSSNSLIVSTAVGIKISILQGTSSGTVVFLETHTTSTNANGLASLEIGSGTPVTGTFAGINWAAGPYFIKTETDPAGGTAYTIAGTNQLMSVPYALFSANGTPGAAGTNGTNGIDGAPGAAGANGNGFSNGTAVNQMMYWSGIAWVTLNPGVDGQVLSICNGNLTWFTMAGVCSASLGVLNCIGAITTGTLTSGTLASGVITAISYTGGNAMSYSSQSVSSTGVLGLTASLAAGSLANGAGSINYTITGTPTTSGTASFAITVGGQSCSFTLSVGTAVVTYPNGRVHCAGATAVVDVTNSITGKVWMDRNLGATQVSTSSTDTNSYGDLYQWGRRADGHQCRTSATTATLSSIDQPTHGNFIKAPNVPYDWRSAQNTNLWQGVNGVNNPCPGGYRIPTETELEAERLSWSVNTSVGAFASPLKLPMAGTRYYSNGSLINGGSFGYYWSSKVSGTYSRVLSFNSSYASVDTDGRAGGGAVRCLKE